MVRWMLLTLLQQNLVIKKIMDGTGIVVMKIWHCFAEKDRGYP